MFLGGCIPARLLLVYLAKNGSKQIQQLIAYVEIIIGLGFWIIYLKGWRKTGIETDGEKIWWNNLRPIHGTLYLIFAYMIINNKYTVHAWKILLADVILGLFAFCMNRLSTTSRDV